MVKDGKIGLKDGEMCGTTGENRKLEAIEIILVDVSSEFRVKYSSHVQDIGWTDYKMQAAISGTTGQNKKIEAIKIQGINVPKGVVIKYQTYVAGIGWQEWKKDNEVSGTTGQNRKVEAIKIKLEGTNKYSITYKTHIQDIGWQDWANDGEISGVLNQNKKIEAIQIKIVSKIGNKTTSNIDTQVASSIPQEKLKITGWVMSNVPNSKIQVKVNDKLVNAKIDRKERQDVLDKVKGYGGVESQSKTRL